MKGIILGKKRRGWGRGSGMRVYNMDVERSVNEKGVGRS